MLFSLGAVLCMVCAVSIYFRHDLQVLCIWKIVLFSVLLAFTTILRHNGILFTATLVLALFFYMPKKRWMFLVSIFIFVVGAVRGPLYSALDVKAPGYRIVETMGFPLTVITHVAKSCSSCLDAETAGFVDSLTAPVPDWKNKYDLTGFNSIKHIDDGVDFDVIERAGRIKIMKMMLNCFLNAPVQSVVAVGAMTSIVYGLEVNCDNDPEIMSNNFGITYSGSKTLQSLVVFYTNVMRKTPVHFFISTIDVGAFSWLRRSVCVTIRAASCRKAWPVAVAGSRAEGVPSSPFWQMLCTTGICPSSGTFISSASRFTPSCPKM